MKTKGDPLLEKQKGALWKNQTNMYPKLFMTRGTMWKINQDKGFFDTMKTSVNPSVHLACLDLRK